MAPQHAACSAGFLGLSSPVRVAKGTTMPRKGTSVSWFKSRDLGSRLEASTSLVSRSPTRSCVPWTCSASRPQGDVRRVRGRGEWSPLLIYESQEMYLGGGLSAPLFLNSPGRCARRRPPAAASYESLRGGIEAAPTRVLGEVGVSP